MQAGWDIHSACSVPTHSTSFMSCRQGGIFTLPAQCQHTQRHSCHAGRVGYSLCLLSANTLNVIHVMQARWDIHSACSVPTHSTSFMSCRQGGIFTLPAQ